MRQIFYISSGKFIDPGIYPGFAVREITCDGGVNAVIALFNPDTGVLVPKPPIGVPLYESGTAPNGASEYAELA